MASNTYGINKTGQYQICDNKEVFHEIGVLLGKMWHGKNVECHRCRNCKNCTNYNFLIEDLDRAGFVKISEKSLWRVYRDTNQYGFEIEKID